MEVWLCGCQSTEPLYRAKTKSCSVLAQWWRQPWDSLYLFYRAISQLSRATSMQGLKKKDHIRAKMIEGVKSPSKHTILDLLSEWWKSWKLKGQCVLLGQGFIYMVGTTLYFYFIFFACMRNCGSDIQVFQKMEEALSHPLLKKLWSVL